MATYTRSGTLQRFNTSYPIRSTSSFAPDTTMYCKLNDTVNFQVSVAQQAPFNQIGIAANANDSNPDPGNLGGSSTFSDGTTFTYTWTASSDFFTRWFFFNTGGSAAFEDSISCVIRRVSVASLSMGSNSIAPGGSTTITANTIQGLEPPSGTFGHRLYTYVTDSSGNLISTSGTNGMTFSTVFGSNNYLGVFTTTQTTNTLTVGSGVSAGTYTLHVGHPGVGGSGNTFYGSDHRITSTTFSVATVPSDTTPDAFNLGSDAESIPLNQQIQASQITVAGIDTATPISVSGQGSPRFSINGGSYNSATVTNLTVTNGQTVDFRFDASGSYSTSHTATLNIGGVTDSVTVTTVADPGTGGTTGGAGTGTTYGLQVLNSSGTAIFDPNLRSSHIISTSTFSLGGNGQLDFGPFEGMTSLNTDSIGVMVVGTTTDFSNFQITQTRGSATNGIGEGKFRLKNNTSTSVSGRYYVLRF